MLRRSFALSVCAAITVIGCPSVLRAAPTTALFWSAPEPLAPSAEVKAAWSRVLASRAIVVTDAVVAEPAVPSLARKLAAAVAQYSALRLEDAAALLGALSNEAATVGGGDLDRRALGDLFLYAALTEQELAQNDRAWDAFVEAARIDPTRMLDPARVTPRAASAFHRAVGELTKEPRVELTVAAPPGARLRLDGDEQTSTTLATSPGLHFAQVSCPGYDTWRGTVSAAPPQTTLTPTMRPVQPPGLAEVARAEGPVVLVALHRGHDGARWWITIHARRETQRTVELEEPLASDVEAQARALVDLALGPTSFVAPLAVAPERRATPLVKRWWLWTAVGVGTAALAIGLGVGLTRGDKNDGGSVGGSIGALR